MTEKLPNNNDENETRSIGSNAQRGEIPPLKRIGHFRIEANLGIGGMGSVFRAYDESMKRTVALKVLHPTLDVSTVVQSRFAREAWIAGQLEHPYIIKVHSRGEEGRFKFIAMELADGGSLTDFIREMRESTEPSDETADTVRKFYIDSIVRKFIDLAQALEHIHAKGFIHRDIKPHNILICGDERQLKFSDFGIAHADDMTNLTKAGDFLGTVRYMSPELLTAHRATID